MNHRYFLPHLERLTDNYHLIFYDQKACGDSEIPTDTIEMSVQAFVNDIDKIRSRFKLKKVHILAHSWGTSLALRYAIQKPQYISSLILSNPSGTSYADVREASKLLNAKFDYNDQQKRMQIINSTAFRQNDPGALAELIKLSFAKNMARPDLVDSIQLYYPLDFAKKNASLKYLFRDLTDYDLYDACSKIVIPTLIIEGDADLGLEAAKKLSTTIKSSALHIIPHSGHFPFIENPQLFDQLVREFLRRPGNK
jgi:proline iminopeptidase